MALPKTHVNLIPRLDQKTDSKTAPVGTAILAQNAYRQKTGEYRRRAGHAALAVGGAPSGTLPDLWQMGTHKGALVGLAKTGNTMPWTYSETGAKWAAPGTADANAVRSDIKGAITSTRRSVYSGELRDSFGVTQPPASPDIAIIPGTRLAVIVWQNKDTGTNFNEVIYDLDSQAILHRKTITGDHVHVEASGSNVTLVYYDGSTNLVCRDWSAATAVTGVPVRTTTTAATMPAASVNRRIDTGLTTTANKIAIVYVDTTATTVQLRLYDNSAGTFVTGSISVDTTTGTVGILRDSAAYGNLYVVTAGATDGVKIWIRDATTLAASSNAVLSAAATTAKTNVRNITGYTVPGFTGDYTVLWDLDSAAVSSSANIFDAQIMYCSRVAGSVGSAAVYLRSVSLRSKAFYLNSTDFYVLVAYASQFQPTNFLMRVGGFPDGTNRAPELKTHRWRGYGATETFAGLTNVVTSSSTYLMVVPRVAETRSKGDQTSTVAPTKTLTVGVDLVTLTNNPSATGRPVEFADLMLVPGGQLFAYDGATFAELNFPLYPELPTYTLSAGGNMAVNGDAAPAGIGDSRTDSNYMYCVVYRHTDAFGRVHRSTPSVPVIVTLPSDGSKRSVTLTVPSLRIYGHREMATGTGDNITIEVYRTTLDGVIFYLRTEVKNTPTTATQAISADTLSDEDCELNECTQLYCALTATGAENQLGPLENHSPPQFSSIVQHRDRLFGISADDGQEIWYSEPIAAGVGPIFNEALTLRMDDNLGDCTAMASMDDKLIIFKRSAMYALFGDGPDNNGNGTYPQPHRLQDGVGTSIPRSVATTPEGVWFQSPKGIYLLDRALNAQMAGGVVEDTLDIYSVVDAVHFDGLNQLRLYLSSGNCLVRDYAMGEWYTWTGQTTLAAVRYGTKVAMIRNPGIGNASPNVVWVTDSTTSADAGTQYTMKFTTAWIALGGIGGLQRIYEIEMVGEYVGTHSLRIALSYDYLESITETKEAVGAAPWQYRHKPARQKCHAIKLSLYDVYSGGAEPSTNTFKLSGFGLVAAIKAPGGKLPSAQRFGDVTVG